MHHRRKYCLMVGCLLVLCPFLRAQDTLTSAGVESQSFALYTRANWDELIRFGNVALKKGFDYYYLRYRLGAAYFGKKKYFEAETQFQKALAFNSTDEAMEYLYYCYLYTGEYERARWLSKSFSPDAVTYTGSDKLKAFSFATLETGMGETDSTIQFNNYYYGQVSAGFYVKKRFSIYTALTYFTQEDFRGTTNQFQYYLNGKVPLKNGWSLTMGIQPIIRGYAAKTYITDSIGVKIPSKIPPHIRDSISYRDTSITSQGTAQTKINIVGAMSLTKSISNFDFTIGSAIGAFDTTTQYEHYLGIAYFPLGNRVFYISETGFLHSENHYASTHTALLSSVTLSPSEKLTITASYLANNGGNLIENDGYIVSGTPDFMVARVSFLANLAVTKNISIYGVYQHEDNLEFHEHWPFYYNVFVIGIKYIPK
jgi:hypothetical protein